jgi:hypothetical protein
MSTTTANQINLTPEQLALLQDMIGTSSVNSLEKQTSEIIKNTTLNIIKNMFNDIINNLKKLNYLIKLY